MAAAVRRFGHQAEVWSYGEPAFGFPADRVVNTDRLVADPRYRWRILAEAVERFDVLHFMYGRSLIDPIDPGASAVVGSAAAETARQTGLHALPRVRSSGCLRCTRRARWRRTSHRSTSKSTSARSGSASPSAAGSAMASSCRLRVCSTTWPMRGWCPTRSTRRPGQQETRARGGGSPRRAHPLQPDHQGVGGHPRRPLRSAHAQGVIRYERLEEVGRTEVRSHAVRGRHGGRQHRDRRPRARLGRSDGGGVHRPRPHP